MKRLPVHNSYLVPNYLNYYDANNYQYFNNTQPKINLQRQVSSSLLTVKNNLSNTSQRPQQIIPQIQQIPRIETDIQNSQPAILSIKNEPKIIRVQKKIFRRNLSQKNPKLILPSKSMDYSGNFNYNYLVGNINYNNKVNDLNNINKNIPLINIKPIEQYSSKIYEVTSPVKKNKVFYNNHNSSQRYNYYTPKSENKFTNQKNNFQYNYNNYDYQQNGNENNINYITDITPNENEDKINPIYDTKVNSSMNYLTNNYLVNSNNDEYFTNNNAEYFQNSNYTEPNHINNNLINTFNKTNNNHLYNNYYANSYNNTTETNLNKTNNYNIHNNQIPKLITSHSSSNIRYNNNFHKNKTNIIAAPLKMNNISLNRSISMNNKKSHNNNYNSNQLYKNAAIQSGKIQNITVIKDPMISKKINNDTKILNYYNYQELPNNNINNSYNKQNMSPYNNNINNNVNNSYNINFNININHDYNNPNNINNINNTTNPLQIERPELEPSSNFNLSEFIKIGIVGRGTEGIIYAVKWKKNNEKYALKKGIIKLMEVVKKRQEEINMLKEFRKKTGSDGVINIYGYLCITNKLNYFDFYEIMELAEIDWDQEIEQRGKLRIYYPEYELMNIMYQIVHTFSLLQKNHITHRDIKPQNIIIVKGKYKVIDFGNARILKRDGLVIQRIRGSEMYMSPIMFKGYHAKMPRVKHNTFKSDVFSLGMCFLLAASLSYTPLNKIREEYDINVINNIVKNYIGIRYSDKINSIILSMLQIEENLRPDFIQLEQYFN